MPFTNQDQKEANMANSKSTATTSTTVSTTSKARKPRAKKVETPVVAPVAVPEPVVEPAPAPEVVTPYNVRVLARIVHLALEASDATSALADKVRQHGEGFPKTWETRKEGQAVLVKVRRDAYLANQDGWRRWLADLAGLAKVGGLKAAFSPKGLKISK